MRFSINKLFARSSPDPKHGYNLIKQYVMANSEQQQQRDNALSQFYNAYYNYMYKLSLNKWKLPEEDAEGMFYNVFYKLVNPKIVSKLEHSPERFNGYIWVMVQRMSFNIYVKNKKKPPLMELTPEMQNISNEIFVWSSPSGQNLFN
jgi:hypothetical protein